MIEVVETNHTEAERAETAKKLGISEEQLEEIYLKIKEVKPSYHYGYDYDRIIIFLNKMTERQGV